MNLPIATSCGLLMLLLFSQDQARARAVSNLQSFSRLLDEDFEHPLGSEELDHEKEEIMPNESMEPQEPELKWTRSLGDQFDSPSLTFQQLINDFLHSSRRYRRRSKKGLSRGCFGVKLDRIGALSGLGC
ncbi:C-type natriuretic peptide 1-like [Microcaecilia unicolor]|uniref:C-type natriuretic peptide 1-like n=1 Tax=Microcaecilia unicolor TaxID=1415580 RepID=A0A6P7ZVC3_9AMPH|nr:C-type natriuretic peptide 1-like [Microcaecilia unicolor]